MLLLYNFAIRIYALGVNLSALFGNAKAKLWHDGRKNFRSKISSALKKDERRIWFHCASLGEFEQGRPVIEGIRNQEPGIKIVLTFFSPSGYEHKKHYEGADYIFYLPLDTKSNARDFINLLQPEKVFFVKYDYWFHYFSELKKRNIKTYLVSSIFREGQMYFKWYGKFFRRILLNVHYFFLQDETSARLLKSIGLNNFEITGDTRFDRVLQIAAAAKSIPQAEEFKSGKKIIVAGSTWHEDDLVLVETVRKLSSQDLKWIIVPHEIGHRHIGELEYNLIEKAGLKPDDIVMYTHEKENLRDAKVLIVDTVGLLSSLYHYGNFAYIGGGFGKGIHNILEAAVYGMPVFFGTNYEKFNEAAELIEQDGAFSIRSSEELSNELQHLLSSGEHAQKVSLAAKNYVAQHSGATGKILKHISD